MNPLPALGDLLVRAWRLDGPVIAFTDRPTPGAALLAAAEQAACPVPNPPGDGAAPDIPPADNWPAGRGRHADNCRFLDDPRHYCLNSYGEPIRPGQSCWHSARAESLRSFAEAHPRLADTLGVQP